MKRILTIIICCVLLFALIGCSQAQKAPESSMDEKTAASEMEKAEGAKPASSAPAGAQASVGEDREPILVDESFIFDEYSFDIDGDGVIEDCAMMFGPTSGMFTITVTASAGGKVKYRNTLLLDHGAYSFGRDEHAGEILKDEEYYRIYTEEDRIVIEKPGQGSWDYWGGEEWNYSLP